MLFDEDNEQVGSAHDIGRLTRLYTDKTIDSLANKRDKSKPFVLYVAHTKIDAMPRFKGTSLDGLYGGSILKPDGR